MYIQLITTCYCNKYSIVNIALSKKCLNGYANFVTVKSKHYLAMISINDTQNCLLTR
ncbi:unnamed protein product [Callosobruchus maculatus]|uniref:Uncharacterized protein n=1 Tax=Callosobruchus maculatus TaxID=64391 RepID=A0A653BZ44_CALMS|nr:unnamed protein product [Callosobruchus maculatus]